MKMGASEEFEAFKGVVDVDNMVGDIEDVGNNDYIYNRIFVDAMDEQEFEIVQKKNEKDEQEFEVEGAYIPRDERDRILSSEVISLEDARVLLSCKHSFSLSDALEFINTKFPKSQETNLKNDKAHFIYLLLTKFCRDYGPTPNIVCFDPDDPKTWEPFKLDSFRFTDQENSYSYGGRPLHRKLVFELYSITINKLDPTRDFSLIVMTSHATNHSPFIIYKHPEGKEIDHKDALPIRIPLVPPTADESVCIYFTNKGKFMERWCFSYGGQYYTSGGCTCLPNGFVCNCKSYPIIIKECEDRYHKSVATISYRIIKSGTWAKLTFKIFEEENRNIYVTYGVITAMDGKDKHTKRIIRQYPKGEAPVCLPSRKELEVYRCVFGVPKNTYLRVEVELAYFVEGSPDEEKRIQGSLDFMMPKNSMSELRTLCASPPSSTSLFVQTFWTSPGAPY